MPSEKEELDHPPNERVRWGDEEQGRGRALSISRGRLSRANSTDSMAIRRMSRTEVDPAVTLPIQYRTV